MKQLLVIAIALASVNAFASRARVTSLGNAPHLVDTQTVYSNPSDIMILGDYVNFESGTNANPSNTAQNANSEGMITRSMGNSKFGLGLGNQSKNASIWTGAGLRSFASSAAGLGTIKSQQNPVTFVYGTKVDDMNLAGSLIYSNFNDKFAGEKESSAGIRLGLRTGNWDAKLGLGLLNTYENSAAKFKGTTGISAGAGYMMEDTYFNGFIETAGFKAEDAAGTELRKFNTMTISLGALKSIKKDGSELFYGIGLTNGSTKIDNAGVETKISTMSLPITLGMEVDAASWLTLRGSVTQSTVINSSKTELAGSTAAETAPGANNTVASVGAGLKFNKLTLDGSLQGLTGGAQSQNLSGNELLTQVGVTYLF